MKNIYSALSKIGVLLIILLSSCTIDEGKGGGAQLFGQVICQEIYSSPILGIEDSVVAEYPLIDERVYIIYGDNNIYDDDFKTDYDGWYKFDELKKGTYTIFAYEPCDTCEEEVKPVFLDLEIEKNSDMKEAPILYLQKRL